MAWTKEDITGYNFGSFFARIMSLFVGVLHKTYYFMPILTMSNNFSNPDMDNVCSHGIYFTLHHSPDGLSLQH